MNTPTNSYTIEKLVRSVCKKVEAFIVSALNTSRPLIRDLSKDEAQVTNGAGPEWVIGEGGVKVDHLVLVSIKRISVGYWVPCIRLVNGQQ